MNYGNGTLGRLHIVHLDRNEDVYESLHRYASTHGILNGVILTGYGTIDRCRFHSVTGNSLPPEDKFTTIHAPLEVLGIHGIIAGGEIHAHMEVADLDHSFGGHLEPGCRVLYLCDLVIAKIEGVDLAFERRAQSGLRLLFVRPGVEEQGLALELDNRDEPQAVSPAVGWES